MTFVNRGDDMKLSISLICMLFFSATIQADQADILNRIANPYIADVPGAYEKGRREGLARQEQEQRIRRQQWELEQSQQLAREEREQREQQRKMENLDYELKKIKLIEYCESNPSQGCTDLLAAFDKSE
jgi:hypothetical protein